MKIDHATVLYLSGTGTTEAYAHAFAEALPFETDVTALRHDVSAPEKLGSHALLVLAGPVFAGYMPPFIWERLEATRGDNTPCVLLAVYGARDYDNALFEMNEKLKAKGFVAFGAAALVARHSIAQTVAANRPGANDIAEVKKFAGVIAKRLEEADSADQAPAFTFKNHEINLNSAVYPITSDACIECGICASECPAGAIPADNPSALDQSTCISCLRCIEVCPEEARALPAVLVEKVTTMLGQAGATSDKPNEFF